MTPAAHARCRDCYNIAMEHAIRCGELLARAKESVDQADAMLTLEFDCNGIDSSPSLPR